MGFGGVEMRDLGVGKGGLGAFWGEIGGFGDGNGEFGPVWGWKWGDMGAEMGMVGIWGG